MFIGRAGEGSSSRRQGSRVEVSAQEGLGQGLRGQSSGAKQGKAEVENAPAQNREECGEDESRYVHNRQRDNL